MRSYAAGYTVICFVPKLENQTKQNKKNHSNLNVRPSEAQLCSDKPGESWEDIRYPHMLCPLGTGSWQNWGLSMDRG